MSRFVFIAMLVCVGVAATKAEGDAPDPSADVEALTQGMMQKFMQLMAQMNSAANCPTVCGDGCAAEAAVCVDVPDVLSCEEQAAACASACSELCDCLAACSVECGPCDQGNTLQMASCTVQASSCLGPCEAKCPVNQMNNEAKVALAKATDEAGKMITMFMGMMSQEGGAQ